MDTSSARGDLVPTRGAGSGDFLEPVPEQEQGARGGRGRIRRGRDRRRGHRAELLASGSSDPGCKAYSGSALTTYNETIDDLNAQASQSVLSADMSTATTDLNAAISPAKSDSVKSAWNGLLTQLNKVKTDVKSGTGPYDQGQRPERRLNHGRPRLLTTA